MPDPHSNEWVSIGTLDTDDPKRRVDFFSSMVTSAQVAGYPQGWSVCQVMVNTGDVERVHAFLKTNLFQEKAFHSIWTNH